MEQKERNIYIFDKTLENKAAQDLKSCVSIQSVHFPAQTCACSEGTWYNSPAEAKQVWFVLNGKYLHSDFFPMAFGGMGRVPFYQSNGCHAWKHQLMVVLPPPFHLELFGKWKIVEAY